MYLQVLDTFMVELERRFNSENIEIMRAAQCFSPDSRSFFDTDEVIPLVRAYSLDEESFKMEAILTKRALKGKEMANLSDVVKEVYPLRAAFPTLFKILQMLLLWQLPQQNVKKSFSSLKRINTCLRSTMTNDRPPAPQTF